MPHPTKIITEIAKTHYEILNLPHPKNTTAATSLDPSALKAAYRRALLTYHPDKISLHNGFIASTASTTLSPASSYRNPSLNATHPSIDQITTAYQTLSNPTSRAQYDRELRLSLHSSGKPFATRGEEELVGLEVVDLDDLIFDQEQALWTRTCRCGSGGGFNVREDELDTALDEKGMGEVVVQCSGCSLSLKVMFAMAEEEE
jgi:diphthamide biosynthesis protein 4